MNCLIKMNGFINHTKLLVGKRAKDLQDVTNTHLAFGVKNVTTYYKILEGDICGLCSDLYISSHSTVITFSLLLHLGDCTSVYHIK